VGLSVTPSWARIEASLAHIIREKEKNPYKQKGLGHENGNT
jgi:hypothetical protein